MNTLEVLDIILNHYRAIDNKTPPHPHTLYTKEEISENKKIESEERDKLIEDYVNGNITKFEIFEQFLIDEKLLYSTDKGGKLLTPKGAVLIGFQKDRKRNEVKNMYERYSSHILVFGAGAAGIYYSLLLIYKAFHILCRC